ncbi:hypothetical protein ABEF95_003085 [Exophiala dermatitidis]
MLTRTTALSHVCLRCQRRLLRDKGPLQAPPHPVVSTSGRRRGHTAVQLQQDEDNDHRAGDQPESSTPQGSSDLNTNSQNDPVAEKGYRFRRWRPTQTAKLGVNTLGKPAEVLILPSRNRRIPKVPKEEESQDRPSLHESLASEQEPLSIQGLVANIEQVVRASGIEKKRGQLEVREWEILRSSLAKGFKLDHLRRYIAYKHKNALSTDAFHRVNRQNKPDTIKYLVEEVWGYTVPVTESSSSKTKRRSLSLYIPDEARLEHLLKDRSQPLKRIAEELDVQIDLFRRESRIRVAGVPSNAAAALARISRLVKDLQPIIIPLQGAVGDMSRDPALKQSVKQFLDSVQQKFDVQIALAPDHIKIVHNEQHRLAQQAHREIRLALEEEYHAQEIDVWPPASMESSSLQPFPTPPEYTAGLVQSSWARLTDSAPDSMGSYEISNSDAERTVSLDSMIGRISDWLNSLSAGQISKSRHELYYRLTADLGQALFRERSRDRTGRIEKGSNIHTRPDSKTLGGSADRTAPEQGQASIVEKQQASSSIKLEQMRNPYFTSQIPFLVQQLALMKHWNPVSSKPAKDVDSDARLTLRLEFAPTSSASGSQSHGWPTFEVLVTAGELEHGKKRPPLDIARVSVVHHRKSFTILCPSQHVDVRITQQLKQDLLYPGAGTGKDPKHTPLLRAIKGYFSRTEADDPRDWLFQPFVALPVDDSMKGVSEKIDSVGSPTKQKQRKQSQQQEVPTSSTTTDKGSKKGSVTYILRTVDVIDVDSREVAVTVETDASGTDGKTKQQQGSANLVPVKFCLDHITLTGTEATRQELRLAERSVLHPLTLTQPDVDVFVKAALQLADRLGKDPTSTTKPGMQAEIQVQAQARRPAVHPTEGTEKKKQPSVRKDSSKIKTSKSSKGNRVSNMSKMAKKPAKRAGKSAKKEKSKSPSALGSATTTESAPAA